MSIRQEYLCTAHDGERVYRYHLQNQDGTGVVLMNLGANITGISVPDRYGKIDDVVLGFDDWTRYLQPHGSMGDTIGRFANRIDSGRFAIDGVAYQLPRNAAGKHHIHGVATGFGTRVWHAECEEGADYDRVIFSRVSPDGEEGYPGAMHVRVSYTWDNNHALTIHYQAETDQPILCNLTNHAYFNLGGSASDDIQDHRIQIEADSILDADADLIPNGNLIAVQNTAFDFHVPARIGDRLSMCAETPQMRFTGGFDHFYLLNHAGLNTPVVTVWDDATGRKLEMRTNQPGFQVYTANGTNIDSGKGGKHYGRYAGFCLEAQDCPNSPNLSTIGCKSILRPGEIYDRTTIYSFSTFSG